MRRANPHELKTRAIPALTAHLSEAELLKWVPVPFDEIVDPLATPEPSKGALVRLDSGGYVVLYYGHDSHQLVVEIPETTADASALLEAFLDEVPIPASRILWRRSDLGPEPSELLLQKLPDIERIIASIGRRNGMDQDETEEFAAEVNLRLVRDD